MAEALLSAAERYGRELKDVLDFAGFSHAEIQRMLTTAWGETNALRREQTHATAIGEHLESPELDRGRAAGSHAEAPR